MIHSQRLPAVAVDPETVDPEILSGYLEDASGRVPGTASGLVRVTSEAAAATLLRQTGDRRVLFQAARSSLTGGAVPEGELILSVERMAERGPIKKHSGGGRVTVQPGTRLRDLQVELSEKGFYYPPVPTYQLAMLGGTVATNAGGSATFKYGVTRNWVHGLRVLLFNGELLVIERGQHVARRGDLFRIVLSDGRRLEVPVPGYRLPAIKKISAGYHSSESLDLVDLFIGSEGTLGLITAVTVNLIPLPVAVLGGVVFLEDPKLAQLLAAALRDRAQRARENDDPRGPDVRAIEWLDEHSLKILRGTGFGSQSAQSSRIAVPPSARAAIFFELELPERMTEDGVSQALSDFLERKGDGRDTPLGRLFGILEDHRALDRLEVAFPEDEGRRRALLDLREGVPTRVNEILARRRREHPEICKVGGDLVVPFGEMQGMLEFYRQGFERRGLQYAIWGHLSDGNLHPNALPRNADETRAGFDALLEFGDEAARRGGCPLSEHGVGRSAIKQEILRRFLGDSAIDEMRRIKRAMDPPGRIAPGVLFPGPT